MCSLSFIPLSDKEFILTTNRDEDPRRVAFSPKKYLHNGVELVYPKDSKANGSWMICNCIDTSLCLLNGAFERHQRQTNYRHSRGLMLLDFFNYANLDDFIGKYNFKGIEAFTLIIVENKSQVRLTELVWDEEELFVKELQSHDAYFWSSTTLYTKNMKIERERWFREWFDKETQIDQKSILKFHKMGGAGNMEYGLCMNRKNRVRTVSISQIEGSRNGHEMKYFDLLENKMTANN